MPGNRIASRAPLLSPAPGPAGGAILLLPSLNQGSGNIYSKKSHRRHLIKETRTRALQVTRQPEVRNAHYAVAQWCRPLPQRALNDALL